MCAETDKPQGMALGKLMCNIFLKGQNATHGHSGTLRDAQGHSGTLREAAVLDNLMSAAGTMTSI